MFFAGITFAAAGATKGIVVLLAYTAVVPANNVKNQTYFSRLQTKGERMNDRLIRSFHAIKVLDAEPAPELPVDDLRIVLIRNAEVEGPFSVVSRLVCLH